MQRDAVTASAGGWSMEFAGPRGQAVGVGTYRNAKRYPFHDDSPGLSFTGHGRGCNRVGGEFVVWELERNGNRITRLAIDFVQRCEENGPPLLGRLRYNSTFQ